MRLFIAVNLSAAERDALAEATRPLRASSVPVRWVAPDALHLTLRFLGEVPEPRAAALAAALAGAVRNVHPFDLGLGGVGAFPELRHPRVVWCGVERHPALELLAHDVERLVVAEGFEPDVRPFHPHVTLGRARRDADPGAFAPLAGLAAAVSWATVVPVASVEVMRSQTGPQGAAYTEIGRAPLAGGR